MFSSWCSVELSSIFGFVEVFVENLLVKTTYAGILYFVG